MPEPARPSTVLRVTQQDVARAAGVHNSTVSLALRGSPTISTATRDRVRRIAAAMGYTPDPAVQALVAYRIRLARRTASASMAFITSDATECGWRRDPAGAACFLGAQERAAELGFTLDHFWAGESGLSQRRLNQILYHRSITGVILLARRGERPAWEELAWERLSGVVVGAWQVSPHLHRVTIDPAGNMRLAFSRARQAGYRRIGVVLPEACDAACDGAWTQALAGEQARLGGGIVPALIVRRERGPACDEAAGSTPCRVDAARLARWIGRHRPEIILGWASWVQPALAALGVAVPRDIALLDLDRAESDTRVAGIRQNHAAVGAIAVDRVVQLLHQNQRGAPAIPTRTLVEGVWCEGNTMPGCEPASGRPGEARCSASHLERLSRDRVC